MDELNAFVGMACLSAQGTASGSRRDFASGFSTSLFNLGSILATLPEDVHPKQPRVTEAEIEQLEHEIDAMNAASAAAAQSSSCREAHG